MPPPPAITPDGPAEAIEGVEPGFMLCVSRLLPYKNVDAVVEALRVASRRTARRRGQRPLEGALRATAGANVMFVGQVTDAQLRWLYASCQALIAASYEDFGLTPLEAATFGKPTAALRWGGFLDTIEEGLNGVFFDEPTAAAVSVSVSDIETIRWRAETIRSVAESWSERRFAERIRESAAITH